MDVKVYGNNIEGALRTLKRKLVREGFFKEIRDRRYYEKPSQKKKRKLSESIKKQRKVQRIMDNT